jgi:DNA-binding CsgD family transcriptional regulator
MSTPTLKPAAERSAEPREHAATAYMATLDRGLRIVAANHELFTEFAERPDGQLCGSTFCDLLHPSLRTTIGERLRMLLDGRASRFTERGITLLRGRAALCADLVAHAVSREGGRPESLVVAVRPQKGDGASAGRAVSRPRRVLTDMDARILEGVASGASTVQLAGSLFLSRGGIEYHVTALFRKLRVKNRAALISKAYALGYFEMGSWPPQVATEHVQGAAEKAA